MFKQFNLKVIGGIVFIAILLVSSTYIYTQWSYKQFVSEFDVPPQSKTTNKPITPSEQTKSTLSPESVNEHLEIKQIPIVESHSMNETEDREVSAEKAEGSDFDPTHLFSTFGIPEEVTSLLDGEPDKVDYEQAQAYLQEQYGQSAEVEAIMDRLKQMSGGTVELEDITALFEDWIELLPDEQQENRQNLMRILTMLRQMKGQGGSVYVVTDMENVPSELQEHVVEQATVTNIETITIEE